MRIVPSQRQFRPVWRAAAIPLILVASLAISPSDALAGPVGVNDVEWRLSSCNPKTKTSFGWHAVLTINFPQSTLPGLTPGRCDFWEVSLDAAVDADDDFRVTFHGRHLDGPHDTRPGMDIDPNPKGVSMTVLNPNLFPPRPPPADWEKVRLEMGENFQSVEHDTTASGVKHIDTFGLWALRAPAEIHFWFSGIHTGGCEAPLVEQTVTESCLPPEPPPVPEPASVVLVSLGLVAVLRSRRGRMHGGRA